VDQLLRARACAPNASVPTVRRNHLFPPTKEKNRERFRKNEKILAPSKMEPACPQAVLVLTDPA